MAVPAQFMRIKYTNMTKWKIAICIFCSKCLFCWWAWALFNCLNTHTARERQRECGVIELNQENWKWIEENNMENSLMLKHSFYILFYIGDSQTHTLPRSLLFAQSLLTRHRMCSLYGSLLCVVWSALSVTLFFFSLLLAFLIANYTCTHHKEKHWIHVSLSRLHHSLLCLSIVHTIAHYFQYLNWNRCRPQISVEKSKVIRGKKRGTKCKK